jgi:hypothetical protein
MCVLACAGGGSSAAVAASGGAGRWQVSARVVAADAAQGHPRPRACRCRGPLQSEVQGAAADSSHGMAGWACAFCGTHGFSMAAGAAVHQLEHESGACVCCSGAVAPVAGASQLFAQHQAMPGGVQTYIAACLQGPHARWVIGISRLCDLLGEHADTLS